MKPKSILMAALLATAAVSAQAQDTAASQVVRLTLSKAISIALSDNPTIKIADYEMQRVDYSKKTAWGALLPTLSGSAQYTRNVKPQVMSVAGMTMQVGTDNSLAMGLSLSLPLVVPALWYSIQMSNLDMYLSIEKSRASKITLKNEVSKAYYNIMLAQDSYMTLQESYDIAKQNYDLAKQRYETGMAAEYDYVSAEVQLNNTLPTLLQAENGVAQSKLYLKVLLGLPMPAVISIESSLTDFEDNVQSVAVKDAFSIKNNSDLIQLDFQQQQLAKSLDIQNTQHLPTLAGFGNFQYQGMGNDKGKETEGFTGKVVSKGVEFPDPSLAVGLTLSVPIFSGMSNVYKAKQIKIQQKQLDEQREYLENSLGVQARTALDNMDKAAKQVDSNKKGVDLARKGYQISQTRYTSGAGTMLELNNSALSLTQAKLQYNQAIVDYLAARADFEKIVGNNP